MKVEILFPEVGNLCGDLMNIRYLRQCCPELEVLETDLKSRPAFLEGGVDLVYMGSATEKGLELMVKALTPYREELAARVDGGQRMLVTGNALDALGEYVQSDQGLRFDGLGLLPTRTVFSEQKRRTQVTATVTAEPFAGAKLTGYEIHTGRTMVEGTPFDTLADGQPEGCVNGSVFGTYLHGLFDTGELTEKLTVFLCKQKGIAPEAAALVPMEQYRQQQFDLLADGVRGALDMAAVYRAMGMER